MLISTVQKKSSNFAYLEVPIFDHFHSPFRPKFIPVDIPDPVQSSVLHTGVVREIVKKLVHAWSGFVKLSLSKTTKSFCKSQTVGVQDYKSFEKFYSDITE